MFEEEHLRTLSEMFPTVDSDVRQMVLETSGNNLDRAIDSLLEMTSPEQSKEVSKKSNGSRNELQVVGVFASSSSNRSRSPSPANVSSASRDELDMYRQQVTSTPLDQLAQDEAFAQALALAMQIDEDQDAKKWTNFFGNSSTKSATSTKEGKSFTAKIDEYLNKKSSSSGRSTPSNDSESLKAKWNAASSGISDRFV